jgi:hypothetical protein
MRAMSLINLEAIRNAELQTDPFDFMVAPGFLSPDVLARVATLMEEMQGEAFASALGEKFDMDLASLPNTVTVRKFCERTDGNIHTDHKSKVITVLVYFNEKWEHEDGQLRMLRSKGDIEDYVAQVPPLGGTLLAFRRTDHSWHGHTQFVGERRMVQLNYLDQSPLAVAAQRISRFGTHFMKNVLGMR